MLQFKIKEFFRTCNINQQNKPKLSNQHMITYSYKFEIISDVLSAGFHCFFCVKPANNETSNIKSNDGTKIRGQIL